MQRMLDLLALWLVPPRRAERPPQASLLALTLVLAALSCALFGLLPDIGYSHTVYLLGGVSFTLLWYVQRKEGLAHETLAHVTILVSLAVVLWVIMHSGGVNSPKMVWLGILALVPLYTLPRVQGFAWVGVVLALIWGLYAYTARGFAGPVPQGEAAVLWAWLNRAAIISCLMVFLLLYRDMQEDALAQERQHQAELEVARQRLLHTQQHKEEFIAAAGHELRTPMNAILGLNPVLQDTFKDDPQALEMAEVIRLSTVQLLQVVNNILDYARWQAGRLQLRPEPFDLHESLRAVLAPHAQRAQAKGLQWALQFDPPAAQWVRLDRLRVQQMLDNLVDNAIKHTPQGTVSVSVKLEADALLLTVRDTGEGIAPQRLPSLFNRFAQAADNPTRRHEGTGLGIALCKALAELMGGTISVVSTPGVGSRFWIRLPLSEPPQAVTQAKPSTTLREVVVVDDNSVNLTVARLMVNRLYPQAQCTCFESGAAALAYLASHPVDLVWMDVYMPERDGMAVTRALRAQSGPNAQVPVLAMTGAVGDDELQACTEAGMQGVLVKPLQLEQIDTLVQAAMAYRRAPP